MASRTTVNKLLQELRALAHTTNRRPQTRLAALMWEAKRPPVLSPPRAKKFLHVRGPTEVAAEQVSIVYQPQRQPSSSTERGSG